MPWIARVELTCHHDNERESYCGGDVVVDQLFAPHNIYLDFVCFVYLVQSSSGVLCLYFSPFWF